MNAVAPGDSEQEQVGAAWAKRRVAVSMRIEKAALELFAVRGIDDVTVEEIAAAAGISRRTFYRYFETPDDVLTAMPQRSLARIWQDVQSRPADEHILDALLNGLRLAKVTDADREMYALAAHVKLRSPTAYWRAMARMNPNATEIYRDLIADRLRACGQDVTHAGILASAMISIMHQVSREREHAGGQVVVEDIEAGFKALADVLAGSKIARVKRGK